METANNKSNALPFMRQMLNENIGRVQTLWRKIQIHRYFRPIIPRETRQLQEIRLTQEPLYSDPDESPLISVVIPTYNRSRMVVERSVPSILSQTYQNFEIVIVGDCCTDDTEERIKELKDPRIRFVNLAEHGKKPANPKARWRISGSYGINHAVKLARGKWIATLDDDDVFTPDHLEVLLRFAQRNHYELVYGIIKREKGPGNWIHTGRAPLGSRTCANSACLYRAYLKMFEFSVECWRIDWGEDNERAARMAWAGVRGGFLDQIVAHAPLRPGQTLPGHRGEDREPNSVVCDCHACKEQRQAAKARKLAI